MHVAVKIPVHVRYSQCLSNLDRGRSKDLQVVLDRTDDSHGIHHDMGKIVGKGMILRIYATTNHTRTVRIERN